MTETATTTAGNSGTGRWSRWWSRWPEWSGYAAAVWSLTYGVLGLYWAFGGDGFPFGQRNDPEAGHSSVLAAATAETTAPVIACLGLFGAGIGFTMARTGGRGRTRVVILVFAWAAALVLTVVVPDYRLLMLVTRVVVTPVFAVTGIPGGGSVADFFPWPRVNLVVVVTGGFLWGLAALAYQRRTRNRCANCGHGDGSGPGGDSSQDALRWGRWAVGVAVAVPAIYALSRIAMALGSPIGVPQAFYDEMAGSGVVVGDLVMATLATGAAVLAVGLVSRWGEVFPRWIRFAAGKPVPPLLAIIPASIAAVFITAAGVTEIRRVLVDGFDTHQWGITGPGLLWPLWGIAVGIATYAYYLRRSTHCRVCGRGVTPAGGPAPHR